MLWACILLPHLALDAVLRRHPDPERALALVNGPAQRRTLFAVNAAAAQCGLHRGQSLGAAQALCAELQLVEYDAAQAARWQQFLAAWAYRYSSQVSIEFSGAIVLEVAGSLSLFGPWLRLETQLREELTALGFRHRIALAPSASAAWVLSGHRDGLAVTTAELMQRALAAVPLQRARLPNNTALALGAMGIRDLGKLSSLPRAALAKRYGPELLAHLDRLLGRQVEVLPLYRPPDVFDVRIEFNYEVGNSQALLFPLRRLIADLAAYLSGRDGGVQRFVVRLEHEDHVDSDVVIGLLTPEREAGVLFDLARGRLELAKVPAPVRGMRLLARELPPFVPAARELFDGRSSQAMPWTQLRERLRARLGNASVYNLAATEDHRPERAWRRVQDAGAGSDCLVQARRPTWLLSRPIPLREMHPRLLAGPERIESGWWDGGDAQRDYYVIETSAGQHAWAFCPAGEVGPFMLHGWFA